MIGGTTRDVRNPSTKKRRFVRRSIVALGVVLLVSAGCGCLYFFGNVRIMFAVVSTEDDLAEIREAFLLFRDTHHRWPVAMEEVYGMKISEGTITKDYKDDFSLLPYRCVTDKGLYYQTGTGNPDQVLAMLAEPYRTKLWPLGEMKTIIATHWGIYVVSPSKIIDAGHANTPKRVRTRDKSGSD